MTVYGTVLDMKIYVGHLSFSEPPDFFNTALIYYEVPHKSIWPPRGNRPKRTRAISHDFVNKECHRSILKVHTQRLRLHGFDTLSDIRMIGMIPVGI